MSLLDDEIINIVKSAGGINVPYSFIYEKLNVEDDNHKKKIRTIIRKYCKEKKGYKKGYPDLFLITRDPMDRTRKMISLK